MIPALGLLQCIGIVFYNELKLKKLISKNKFSCTGQKLKIVRHGEAEILVSRGHPEKIKLFTGLPRATRSQ
ncbi:MAG: hypothetical protein O7C59_07715 [Rickettsia endosymbiont of Ixodes persulcatus]|nr:hypothetical protein [Rickettsia endosymbiont of Ixodes persulcatus]